MPYRDVEAKRAAQRRSYARHAAEVKAKVRWRKWNVYGGTCRNCGGPTIGESKGRAAEFCSAPACASAQRRGARDG